MAISLSAYQVADLCLGKPPLRSLSSSCTVAAALAALKSADDTFISVWSCDHKRNLDCDCVCVGKVCMVDIICYLCKKENTSSPALALNKPLSVLLSDVNDGVRHVDPSASLLEAIDLMIQGAQNLVVPIRSSISRRKQLQRSLTTIHNAQEFCWLTQEDVLRFLLSSIGLFSPIAPLPIETLGIINTEFLSVEYNSPASSAIAAISRSLADQTSVAVVDDEGSLIGEISPLTLACCDETAAAAILTLSAGDLMAYIDCGGPTEDMVRVVEEKLKEKKLKGMLKEIMAGTTSSQDVSNSSSSDEELSSPTTTLYRRTSSHSGRMARRAEAVVCHRGSSLVAVMIQAITRRVNYVWVMEDDCSVVGIVTFANMLDVFREHLESLI
ncbi:CBS domain-containing protein CBSX5-like [Salvia miltiorrhiza]|uniref:CBS domain-containing protein CBSX5-like n=1 Tax=Salvia miltiorrhiza TaxID=226208 RepID=UPI0025ACE14A|nr:CBS domain-containing protein CBSX5-like [Salvia miltiorrhiza]